MRTVRQKLALNYLARSCIHHEQGQDGEDAGVAARVVLVDPACIEEALGGVTRDMMFEDGEESSRSESSQEEEEDEEDAEEEEEEEEVLEKDSEEVLEGKEEEEVLEGAEEEEEEEEFK